MGETSIAVMSKLYVMIVVMKTPLSLRQVFPLQPTHKATDPQQPKVEHLIGT